MTKSTATVTMDLTKLENLQAALKSNSFVKLGVLGQEASRSDDKSINNVEIAVIQELGSITRNIPPRSFLRMPVQYKIMEIKKFIGSKKIMNLLMEGDVAQALKLLGVFGEAIVQEAFGSSGFGQWKPNSPVTVARKKSSRPLIDTAQLRRSISSEVVEQ